MFYRRHITVYRFSFIVLKKEAASDTHTGINAIINEAKQQRHSHTHAEQ